MCPIFIRSFISVKQSRRSTLGYHTSKDSWLYWRKFSRLKVRNCEEQKFFGPKLSFLLPLQWFSVILCWIVLYLYVGSFEFLCHAIFRNHWLFQTSRGRQKSALHSDLIIPRRLFSSWTFSGSKKVECDIFLGSSVKIFTLFYSFYALLWKALGIIIIEILAKLFINSWYLHTTKTCKYKKSMKKTYLGPW